MISLECIECHDTLMKEGVSSLGAGTWGHFSRKFNHPIGISYSQISSKKRSDFHSVNELSKELRLFNGMIGCGTCHNIYSKVKYMLVFENAGSRLCLECHIK
jgi:predicted CXXCH cytochrome family protein